MRPQVGQTINNKYRLLRIIGDGGMGSVYEARHELLGTTVALKFLHPELSRRSGLVQRFLQEARVSAQIHSPHVVRVIDVDQQTGGLAFIVMEYLEGKTLQTLYEDLYKAGQRLSYADALEYAMQMIEGVEAAHNAGIVHRDLKPDNVIITKNKRGEPLLKLLDFGIAKLKVTGQLERGLTRPGVVMGTPEYMAPEQAYSADAVDVRADIFSLGVMAFEMLAGRRPVGGDDPHQIATSYMTGQISRLTDLAPHIDAELAAVVHRAIAALPKDRFASVGEFRSALEPFVNTLKGASPTALATNVQGRGAPSPVISPVAIAATPAAGSSDPAPRAIPKTLPPEDEAQAGASEAQRTSMSEPPAEAAVARSSQGGAESAVSGASAESAVSGASAETAAREPSSALQSPAASPAISPNGAPLVGFAATAEASPAHVDAAGAATEAVHVGLPATVSASPFVPDAGRVQGSPGLAPTEDAPPFVPHGNGASKTSPGDAPFEIAMRPSGTAIGGSPFGSTEPADAFSPHPMGVRPGGGTAAMDPLPAPPMMMAQGASKKRGGGSSFFSILLIASGITAMVVGGLYVVQRYVRQPDGQDEGGTATVDPPIAASVTSDPGPAPPPPEPTFTPPPPLQTPIKPPVTPAKPTSTPTPVPTTNPTTVPTTKPTSTSTIPPPIFPSSIPPIVIPSTFPGFPLPGGSIPRPTFPGGNTTTNPPSNPTGGGTTPPSTGGTSTGRPKVPKPNFGT
jgi:serine/threonine-protein kinase